MAGTKKFLLQCTSFSGPEDVILELSEEEENLLKYLYINSWLQGDEKILIDLDKCHRYSYKK